MKSYKEKLLDPRWQKVRLSVLSRAGFKCECCGNEKETLHVHHLLYADDPWDANESFLECLCATCHQIRTECDGIDIFRIRTRPTKEVVTPKVRADFIATENEE